MKKTLLTGLALVLLGLGFPGADLGAQGKSEAIPGRLLQLRSAVISRALPSVRARIGASSAAVLQYAATCGRACDLESFLRSDLKARFSRLSDTELRILMGLTLADSFAACSESRAVRLNDLVQSKNTLVAMMTSLLNESNSASSAILSNIKP